MSATNLNLRCPLEQCSVMQVAAAADVTAGQMDILASDTVGIYVETEDSGDEVAFIYKAPKVVVPAASAATFSQGDKVYYDDTNEEVTNSASGNTLCGIALVAKSGGTETAEIDLDGTLGIVS